MLKHENQHVFLLPTGTIKPAIVSYFLEEEGVPLSVPEEIMDTIGDHLLFDECFFRKHEVIVKIIGYKEVRAIESDRDFIDGIIDAILQDKMIWFIGNESILIYLYHLLKDHISDNEIHYHYSQPQDITRQIKVKSAVQKKLVLKEIRKESVISFN